MRRLLRAWRGPLRTNGASDSEAILGSIPGSSVQKLKSSNGTAAWNARMRSVIESGVPTRQARLIEVILARQTSEAVGCTSVGGVGEPLPILVLLIEEVVTCEVPSGIHVRPAEDACHSGQMELVRAQSLGCQRFGPSPVVLLRPVERRSRPTGNDTGGERLARCQPTLLRRARVEPAAARAAASRGHRGSGRTVRRARSSRPGVRRRECRDSPPSEAHVRSRGTPNPSNSARR